VIFSDSARSAIILDTMRMLIEYLENYLKIQKFEEQRWETGYLSRFNLEKMNSLNYIIILFFLPLSIFGQIKNDPVKIYSKGIQYYLNSSTEDFKPEIVFIETPSFEPPEYSISIEFRDGTYILKYKSFDKSYWPKVWNSFSKSDEMVKADVIKKEFVISKNLAEKIITWTISVLNIDNSKFEKVAQVDGSTFFIEDKTNKRVIKELELKQNEDYLQLVKFLQYLRYVINDLKFNEDEVEKRLNLKSI